MDALLKACDDACGNTRCNPPGMEMIFEDGVEEDQLDAAKAAVAAGVRPQDVSARPHLLQQPQQLSRFLGPCVVAVAAWLAGARLGKPL